MGIQVEIRVDIEKQVEILIVNKEILKKYMLYDIFKTLSVSLFFQTPSL